MTFLRLAFVAVKGKSVSSSEILDSMFFLLVIIVLAAGKAVVFLFSSRCSALEAAISSINKLPFSFSCGCQALYLLGSQIGTIK